MESLKKFLSDYIDTEQREKGIFNIVKGNLKRNYPNKPWIKVLDNCSMYMIDNDKSNIKDSIAREINVHINVWYEVYCRDFLQYSRAIKRALTIEFKEMFKLFGLRYKPTIIYHPETRK